MSQRTLLVLEGGRTNRSPGLEVDHQSLDLSRLFPSSIDRCHRSDLAVDRDRTFAIHHPAKLRKSFRATYCISDSHINKKVLCAVPP